MNGYHNIERSVFRLGEYVGYGKNHVWRIVKLGKRDWQAHCETASATIYADTLREISIKLS